MPESTSDYSIFKTSKVPEVPEASGRSAHEPPVYELSATDLMLVQDLILWARQFKWRGTVLPEARIRRLLELSEEIDRIVVARAAAGDVGSMAAASEVLRRKPAGSAAHRTGQQETQERTGTK